MIMDKFSYRKYEETDASSDTGPDNSLETETLMDKMSLDSDFGFPQKRRFFSVRATLETVVSLLAIIELLFIFRERAKSTPESFRPVGPPCK